MAARSVASIKLGHTGPGGTARLDRRTVRPPARRTELGLWATALNRVGLWPTALIQATVIRLRAWWA
jgi:hypothetical protein